MPQESSRNGQVGVEVTPEMIEAGAEVLGYFDRGQHDRADTAKEVFAAMWAARRAIPHSR